MVKISLVIFLWSTILFGQSSNNTRILIESINHTNENIFFNTRNNSIMLKSYLYSDLDIGESLISVENKGTLKKYFGNYSFDNRKKKYTYVICSIYESNLTKSYTLDPKVIVAKQYEKKEFEQINFSEMQNTSLVSVCPESSTGKTTFFHDFLDYGLEIQTDEENSFGLNIYEISCKLKAQKKFSGKLDGFWVKNSSLIIFKTNNEFIVLHEGKGN